MQRSCRAVAHRSWPAERRIGCRAAHRERVKSRATAVGGLTPSRACFMLGACAWWHSPKVPRKWNDATGSWDQASEQCRMRPGRVCAAEGIASFDVMCYACCRIAHGQCLIMSLCQGHVMHNHKEHILSICHITPPRMPHIAQWHTALQADAHVRLLRWMLGGFGLSRGRIRFNAKKWTSQSAVPSILL